MTVQAIGSREEGVALDAMEYALARQAMLRQASATVEVALGYFDPARMLDELKSDLPAALRALAAGMEAGMIEGRLSGFQVGGGKDDRAHLRMTLALAAPVRMELGVRG